MRYKILKLEQVNLQKFYSKIWLLKLYVLIGKKIIIEHCGRQYLKSDNNLSDELNIILNLVEIINTNNKREKLGLVYDFSCDYLDSEFQKKNLCEFKNNMCGSNRNKDKSIQVGSCCVHLKDRKVCEKFDNNRKICKIKSLGCKLFTCPYLWKKGIKYNINSVPYLKYFLSLRQKAIVKCSFFQDKDEVIEKLIKFYMLP